MEYTVVLVIIVLYVLIALCRDSIEKVFNVKVCSICLAYGITWISMLIARYFDLFSVDNTLLGILMGGSTVGIMYKTEAYFKKENLKDFWLARIFIVGPGILLSYYISVGMEEQIPTVIAISILLAGISFILVKSSGKQGASSPKQREIRSKLEHCCD